MNQHIKSLNQLLVLKYLENAGESYNSKISDGIEECTGNTVLKASHYNMLRQFEEDGLVISYWEEGDYDKARRRRKYYTITDYGIRQIKEQMDAILSIGK